MHDIVSPRPPSLRPLPAGIATPPRVTLPVPGAVLSLVRMALVVVAAGTIGDMSGQWWWRTHVDPGPPPAVARLDLYAQVADLTRLTLSVAGTTNAPWHTTVDELRRNHTLWRMMHLENWNTVPSPLREDVLDDMLAEYRPLLMNPHVWDRMTPGDWDDVPQPVRTVAYRQMVSYWAGFYDVGRRYGMDPRVVASTLQAIAMSESWFDHRAEHRDASGNRDIGLVQASDFARQRVRQLAVRGDVDVSFSEDDYWNPWQSARFLAVWMSLLVDETNGNLDRAVRAYNRGLAKADDPQGEAYLAVVQRRRYRFIQNNDAPPAWTWVWHRSRAIEAEEWPWLHVGPTRFSDHASARRR